MVIFALYDGGNFSDAGGQRKWKAAMKRWPALRSEELRICMQNLQRLGLVAPAITETEILKSETIDAWAAGVTSDNIVSEFTRVVEGLIVELTNFTGNPMNDTRLPDDPKAQFRFARTFVLTRIGFDLWEATSGAAPPRAKKARRKAPKAN